jgi:hypothetical protein
MLITPHEGGIMIAYYVYDEKKEDDTIVLPDTGCSVPVTPDIFEKFISVKPDFTEWSGDACGDLSPEDFGIVIAPREDLGDVCVTNDELWRKRMFFYMNKPK